MVVDLRVAHEGSGLSGSIYRHMNNTCRQPSVEIDLQACQVHHHVPTTVSRDRPSNFQDVIEPPLHLPITWGPTGAKSVTDIYIYIHTYIHTNVGQQCCRIRCLVLRRSAIKISFFFARGYL